MHRRLLAVTFSAAALLCAPVVATATPILVEFGVTSTIGGPVTGSGSVVTDSVNLLPGASTLNFADLTAMSMTLTGIPDSPTSTTFFRANLDDPNFSWILQVNAGGVITDLNFFMRNDGTNADGYSIDGFSPFHFVLCDGPASPSSCGTSPTRDSLLISVTDVRAVPEPTTVSLVALALGALGVRRMAKSRVKN